MNAPHLHRKPFHWGLILLAIALAYAVVGRVALWLAIPTGYASPLFPSAGIALACLLVFGPRAVVGVALGSFCLNSSLSFEQGASVLSSLVLPASFATGASLQALAGAALVRRFVRQPLTLSEPRDIALFFGLGAFVASLVSASLACSVIALTQAVLAGNLVFTWLTWWVGDSMGVLIGAPIVLTLIGHPREEWAPRRLMVGVTLAMVTALTVATIVLVAGWNEERLRTTFEREASSASSTLSFQVSEVLHALEALRGLYLASEHVDREGIHRATKSWLVAPSKVRSMGFAERVPHSQLGAFEARVHAEGSPNYRVSDNATTSQPSSTPSDAVIANLYVQPPEGNEALLGLNMMSIPATREAIESAIRTDRSTATAGFTLKQPDPKEAEQPQIVVYHAIYNGSPTTVTERLTAARGVVFVVLNLHAALSGVLDQVPHYLKVCVVDTDPLAPHRRLWGPKGCETTDSTLLHVRPLAFAGRQWDMRMYADTGAMPRARDNNVWLFSVVGLMSAAILGALLLTVTGRTRRIEAAVRERTAELTQEVREREQAEAAMRESETRFRNIFNNVPIGVCYTDLLGNVKQTNPRFCELVGYSAEELLQMTAADFTYPEDLAQDRELSVRLISGEFPVYRRNKRYIDRNGRTFWIQSTVSLLRDESGEPWRIVSAVEDITEHLKLADAERARAAAELSNRAKSEFLSRMSHELRTPLNAMLGFAQLLELDQRHPLADAQRPWVAQIQQAGWHLLEMINDVLDLSRIESGNLRLTLEPLELSTVLSTTVPMVQSEAEKRGIKITQLIAPNAGVVYGDATRVRQILTNLLSNAVKYNHNGGRIHITSRLNGEMVEFAVADTGLGMSSQQLSELFQPFNRLGRERSPQEGTGIGLVISQRLAELMGGTLRARSVAGEGSSFILSLPTVIDPDTVPSELDALSTTPTGYHRRRVHYVEDNATNVEVMRGILAQRPQVSLDISMTGLEGLAGIRAQKPNVILLDMHLPDISGMDLLRRLKADPLTADIPVVIVSADALSGQIEEAMAAGASRYLTKPVSVSELLSVVDQLLYQADTDFV